MRNSHIVVGCGWGDEGKGVFVDLLANTLHNPVVIRFNGGHQAGHTVKMQDGRSHVFSSFGSGSFRGVPTFISKYCTIDPVGMHNEYEALRSIDVDPVLYVDPMAMVTTPYDKFFNTAYMKGLNHGTVGVGFGATIERNQGPCKLYAIDLFYPEILARKVEAIERYYLDKFDQIDKVSLGIEMRTITISPFLDKCSEVYRHFELATESEIFATDNPGLRFGNFIFEGAQGVMLDMDFGVFPHVTRSNTTSRNAVEILDRSGEVPNYVYHLHRAYSTRHGSGPFKAEYFPLPLQNNSEETNVSGGHQGDFRIGPLDLDSLDYAIRCEKLISPGAIHQQVISCLDQVSEYTYLKGDKIIQCSTLDEFVADVSRSEGIYLNTSPCSETFQFHHLNKFDHA